MKHSNTSTNRPSINRKQIIKGHYKVAVQPIRSVLLLFFNGLKKLIVAGKFLFHRLTRGVFEHWALPWFKIGVAVLIAFIFLRKDIRFQINMQAPSAIPSMTEVETPEPNVQKDQLNLLSVSYKTPKKVANNLDFLEHLNDHRVNQYIQRFLKVAKMEEKKYGIPVAIKLAQGILESKAGDATYTQRNNHFGKLMADQHFDSAWENWRAHSLFINNSKFSALRQYQLDSQKWAKGLEVLGYSTDPNYGDKLLAIIKKYSLDKL